MTQTETPFLRFWRAVDACLQSDGHAPATGGEASHAYMGAPGAAYAAAVIVMARGATKLGPRAIMAPGASKYVA